MFCGPLDPELADSPADLVAWGNCVVLAAYDKSLRMYRNRIMVRKCMLQRVANKLCVYGKWLVAVSLDGSAYLLDSELHVVHSFRVIEGVSAVVLSPEYLLVTGWGRSLALYEWRAPVEAKENECQENVAAGVSPVWVQSAKFRVTTGIIRGNEVVAALEHVLVIFNTKGEETFRKELSCCITALGSSSDGLFIGLINGKIHFEHLVSKDESFVFNAHFMIDRDEKVFYPVTWLYTNDHLYSSGLDGKITKWDVSSKRQLGHLCAIDMQIKKFVLHGNLAYVIVKDEVGAGGLSRALCISID